MNPFATPGEVSFCVIFAPLETASSLIAARICRYGESVRIRPRWAPGVAPYLFSNFIKASREYVLWAPVESDVTVLCLNVGHAGSRDFELFSKSCRLKIAYVAVHDGDTYPYYNALLWLYEEATRKRYIQSILAEDGWEYFQFGEPQPFENQTYSRRRKIRDRLNRDILHEYLLKEGIDIRSDNFWSTTVEPHYFVDGWTVQRLSLEKFESPK